MTPFPVELRQLICKDCGLSNKDQSWQIVDGEWVHSCPRREFIEDDLTPVTEEVIRRPDAEPPPRKTK